MKANEITNKEYAYLVYAYVSISTFVLLTISKITENLERALNFNPIVSLIIILNMIVFISAYVYKRRHTMHHK